MPLLLHLQFRRTPNTSLQSSRLLTIPKFRPKCWRKTLLDPSERGEMLLQMRNWRRRRHDFPSSRSVTRMEMPKNSCPRSRPSIRCLQILGSMTPQLLALGRNPTGQYPNHLRHLSLRSRSQHTLVRLASIPLRRRRRRRLHSPERVLEQDGTRTSMGRVLFSQLWPAACPRWRCSSAA